MTFFGSKSLILTLFIQFTLLNNHFGIKMVILTPKMNKNFNFLENPFWEKSTWKKDCVLCHQRDGNDTSVEVNVTKLALDMRECVKGVLWSIHTWGRGTHEWLHYLQKKQGGGIGLEGISKTKMWSLGCGSTRDISMMGWLEMKGHERLWLFCDRELQKASPATDWWRYKNP